jgi:hypothetical protein
VVFGLDFAWAKVLDFINVEYATLFIVAAKIKDEYNYNIEEQMRIAQVSLGEWTESDTK